MSSELPAARTVTDEILASMHGLLGEIRDRLPEPKPDRADDGEVQISEPGKPPAKKAARKPTSKEGTN